MTVAAVAAVIPMVVVAVMMAVPALPTIVPGVIAAPSSAMIRTSVLVGDDEIDRTSLTSGPRQLVG